MEFRVLNVGHGACAYLQADNTNVMLFDCGHNSDPEFRPSTHLPARGHQSVEYLFISNYDQDHISDLPRLRNNLHIGSLVRNASITADQLRALKLRQSGEISPAMHSMLDMIRTYTGDITGNEPNFPGVTYQTFCNSHPFGNGSDTNNLSMVTILTVNGTTILLPGDMERAGWLILLRDTSFTRHLPSVDIFVASHHGRDNGYCREIFANYGCRPGVFVMSDSSVVHATQQCTNNYAQWASGVQFNGQTRRVLTTRNDGALTWTF